jgi:DNA-binding NarL/FixJ family response regulator
MLKLHFQSHGRTAKLCWQIAQCVDIPFHLQKLNLVNILPKLKKVTKLLIADDSPRARDGLRAILTTQPGIEIVAEASQGDEAIALVEDHRPDVALLDVRMPVLDGIQAARVIKARWPNVRVVLISLYDDYQVEALSSAADAFLVKGCPAEELLSVVTGTKMAEKGIDSTCE